MMVVGGGRSAFPLSQRILVDFSHTYTEMYVSESLVARTFIFRRNTIAEILHQNADAKNFSGSALELILVCVCRR